MAHETPQTSTEVTCPCCQARLTIDLSLGVVLHHELPPKPSSVTDLKEAVEALKTETAQRDARFKERLLKKAKDAPSTPPPPRDIDLD